MLNGFVSASTIAPTCRVVLGSADFFTDAAPTNGGSVQKLGSAPRPALDATTTIGALKTFATKPESSCFYAYTEMKDGVKRVQFKYEPVRPENLMYGRRAPSLWTPPMVVSMIAGRPGVGDDTKDKPCYTLCVAPIPAPPDSITGPLRVQLEQARLDGIAFLDAIAGAEDQVASQLGWHEFYRNSRDGRVSMKMDLRDGDNNLVVFNVVDNRPNGTHEALDYTKWAENWVQAGDIVTVNFEFSFTYCKGANKGIRMTFFNIVKQLDPMPREQIKRAYTSAFTETYGVEIEPMSKISA